MTDFQFQPIIPKQNQNIKKKDKIIFIVSSLHKWIVHEISIPFGVLSTRHINWHLTAKQKSQNYKQNMTSAENKRVGATNKTWHRLIDLSQVKCCWCAGCIDCQKRSLHGWLLYIFRHQMRNPITSLDYASEVLCSSSLLRHYFSQCNLALS